MSQLHVSKSQIRLMDSLVYWMEREPYSEITITQICQQAQLVRQTFYRNFASKDAVLMFYMDYMFEQFAAQHISQTNYPELEPSVRVCFAFLNQHRDFLAMLEQNDLFSFMRQAIVKNLDYVAPVPWLTQKLGAPHLERYLRSCIASTFICVLQEWAKGGFVEDLDTLVNLTCKLFQGLTL